MAVCVQILGVVVGGLRLFFLGWLLVGGSCFCGLMRSVLFPYVFINTFVVIFLLCGVGEKEAEFVLRAMCDHFGKGCALGWCCCGRGLLYTYA